MKTYLITGAAGFIGINYLDIMSERYHNDIFICFDALTYASNKERLNELLKLRSNIKFVKGDISNVDDVDNLFKNNKIDIVINFAAETHVDNSFKNEQLFYKTNVEGTKVLLDACLKHGVKRYHQVSTDEVYGMHELDDDSLFLETDELKPTNPYSISKAKADELVLKYSDETDLFITISRSSNNYGLYQHEEKLIPKIVSKAMGDESIPLYGNGLNKRDWINVIDHCNAIDLIVKNGKSGEIYNVSSQDEISNIELTKKILTMLDKPYDLIEFVKDREIHDLRYGVSSDKISNELMWHPEFTLENSLDEIVKDYQRKHIIKK